jgi:hypothetical protein
MKNTYEKCECGKICYKTKIDAQFALYKCEAASRLKNDHNRHEQRIYFCPLCQTFHLTSKAKLPTWREYKGKQK